MARCQTWSRSMSGECQDWGQCQDKAWDLVEGLVRHKGLVILLKSEECLVA